MKITLDDRVNTEDTTLERWCLPDADVFSAKITANKHNSLVMMMLVFGVGSMVADFSFSFLCSQTIMVKQCWKGEEIKFLLENQMRSMKGGWVRWDCVKGYQKVQKIRFSQCVRITLHMLSIPTLKEFPFMWNGWSSLPFSCHNNLYSIGRTGVEQSGAHHLSHDVTRVKMLDLLNLVFLLREEKQTWWTTGKEQARTGKQVHSNQRW